MLKGKDFGSAIGEAVQRKLDAGFAKSKAEIARHFGMQPPSLSDWVKKGSVAKDKLPELWRYFSDVAGPDHWGLSASEWPSGLSLLSNTQTSRTQAESSLVENVSPAPDVKGRIPLISWIRAGQWSEAVDIYEPGYAERWLPHLKNNGEHTYALRVDGDSMTAPYGKSYPEGCIIFVDPMRQSPSSGERIIAKLEGANQVTFKTYVEDAGRCWLKPLNPQHPPIMEPFRVLGTVIGKWEDD